MKSLKDRIQRKLDSIKKEKEIFGFQLQPGTKLLNGINDEEIDKLEVLFGFSFPNDYRKMLLTFIGFDKSFISIDPTDELKVRYEDQFYQYPRDFEKSKWLIEEINNFKSDAELALSEEGFDRAKIVGYIPIYGHRALVVFEDKSLSPVISVWGSDIIVYGNNLTEYLENEFLKI